MKFSKAYTEHSSKHCDYFEIYDEIISDNRIDRFEKLNIIVIKKEKWRQDVQNQFNI